MRALERQTEAVGVTSWFTIHSAAGPTRYEEYCGEFPTSPDPARRFERMLWFFHAGDAKYDPIYGVYRRDGLERSHRVRPIERTDWLLSTELALMGPILNLDERLAHRTRDYQTGSQQRSALRRRLDPVRAGDLPTSPHRLARELFELARRGEPERATAATLQAGAPIILAQRGGPREPPEGGGRKTPPTGRLEVAGCGRRFTAGDPFISRGDLP